MNFDTCISIFSLILAVIAFVASLIMAKIKFDNYLAVSALVEEHKEKEKELEKLIELLKKENETLKQLLYGVPDTAQRN